MDRLTAISRALASTALALFASSCVVLVFTRTRTNAPIDEARVAELAPGRTTFADALLRLGAPTDVWELPGGARAIAYGWLDQKGDNVNVQVPVSRNFTPNLEIEDARKKFYGVVLFFDESDVLVEVRRGFLRTLKRESLPSADDE
ncbi:MAG: hypothetical protein L6Q99_08845 [Planctomycetes bacterium]|nr:hypothetical protein [Planctomycetota bacterium]